MKTRYILGIICAVLVVGLVIFLICFGLLGQPARISRVLHGKGSMNFSMSNLPRLAQAYNDEDSIVFPVALFNGGLPLIVLHVGESSSKAAAIVDTASETLLLGDIETCESCSSDMFGGARGSDSQDSRKGQTETIIFGSQRDKIDQRTEDVYLDDYFVPDVSFGLTVNRESFTSTNVTYNIMGVGGTQAFESAFANQLNAKLRSQSQDLVLGFMLGQTGGDQDETGVFVLGPLTPSIMFDYSQKVTIPLDKTPQIPYYYTTSISKVKFHLYDGTILVHEESLPLIFDTGSNFADFPDMFEDGFDLVDSIELEFSDQSSLRIPSTGLRHHNTEYVNFSRDPQNMITIGTLILTQFSGFEYVLNESPYMNFYVR